MRRSWQSAGSATNCLTQAGGARHHWWQQVAAANTWVSSFCAPDPCRRSLCTGREIERALLTVARAHPNISFFEHHLAVDLVTDEVRLLTRSFAPALH